MTIKFAKRAAAAILRRGVTAIKIKQSSYVDVNGALTREDVRRLIEKGDIFAVKEKENASINRQILKAKRNEGRRRGPGRRKGTRKARQGRMWEKKVRSQRMFLKQLKVMKKIDNQKFNELYGLIKGNSFASKQSLVIHLADEGIKVTEAEVKQINDYMAQQYK